MTPKELKDRLVSVENTLGKIHEEMISIGGSFDMSFLYIQVESTEEAEAAHMIGGVTRGVLGEVLTEIMQRDSRAADEIIRAVLKHMVTNGQAMGVNMAEMTTEELGQLIAENLKEERGPGAEPFHFDR